MPLGINNVHVDAPLTNVAVNYSGTAGGLMAEEASKVIKVAKESDLYYSWTRADQFRVPETYKADGAEANEFTTSASTTAYVAHEYALKVGVTDRQKANADNVLQLRKNKMRIIQDQIRMDQESRVATLMTTQGNFPAANRTQLATTTQWNNASFSGSIEADVDTGMEAIRQAIGLYPNTIIIPAAVAKVMKRNAEIRELVKYTQSNLLVNGDLPPTLWNMKVVIPGGINVSTQKGASTDTFGDIWGKHCILTFRPEGSALDIPSHSLIFRARDWLVKSWREESKDTEFIQVSVVQDEVLPSSVSGYLIEDAIA